MNYCANDCCYNESNEKDLLCWPCNKKILLNYNCISEFFCMLQPQNCSKDKCCWQSALIAFYYYDKRRETGKTPRDKIDIEKISNNFEFQNFSWGRQILKCDFETAIDEIEFRQRPGFIKINGHHFIIIGIHKNSNEFLLQSFCDSKISFETLKKQENQDIYFLNER